MDEVPKIVQLTERAKKIRQECIGDGLALLNGYRWDPKRDLRMTSNTRLTRVITGLCVSFVYLTHVEQEEILEGIRLSSESGIPIVEYQAVNELFIKIGFVTSLFLVIESVMRDYLRFLDEEGYKSSGGVMNICDILLTRKLAWNRTVVNCHVVDFLRLIRNTVHNNGVHRPLKRAEKRVEIEYKGANFEFKDGERLDFVSWDLLLDIAGDIRELIFHLAHDKAISSIASLIPDKHAI
ncbi:MAG: hypothetical protein WBZ24_15200 [Anaerolineales bacterium]